MKRTKRDIPDLRTAFAPMPESFHRRIVTALREEQKPMKVRNKMTIALAAALIAMLALGVTAFAIARSAIFEHYFRETEPSQTAQQLLHEGGTSVEENGVRMELSEYLYDPQANTIYLTVRMQSLTPEGALVSVGEPAFSGDLKATSKRTYVASPLSGGMTMIGGECEGEALATQAEYVLDYTFTQQPPEQVQLTLEAGIYDSVNAPVWGSEGNRYLYRHYYENRLTVLCGSTDGNFVDFSSYVGGTDQELRVTGRTCDEAFATAVENGFVTKRGELTLTADLTLSGAKGNEETGAMTAVEGESDLTMEVIDYAYYAPKRELTLYLRTTSDADTPRAWGVDRFSVDGETLAMDDPVDAHVPSGWDNVPVYGMIRLLGEGTLGGRALEKTRTYVARVYLPERAQPGDTLTLRMHGMSAKPSDSENGMTENPYASVYRGRNYESQPDGLARVMDLYSESGAASEVREEAFDWTFTLPREGDARSTSCQRAEFDDYSLIIRQTGAGVLSGELCFEVYPRYEMKEIPSKENWDAENLDPLYRWYRIFTKDGQMMDSPSAGFSFRQNGLGERYISYSYTLSSEMLAQESILIVPCVGYDADEVVWDECVEIAWDPQP